MRVNDPDLLDDELIQAALEAAINQPLCQLLSIAEFAEKADLPVTVAPADDVDSTEWRSAA